MKSETRNIVELEFEKLGLPDNVVANIMDHHGGVTIDQPSGSDSEGLNGNYELSHSSSDSEVDGDTGGTSY